VLLTEVYVRQMIRMVMKNAGGVNAKLEDMYDELESHLRALESLGVTQEQSAARFSRRGKEVLLLDMKMKIQLESQWMSV